MMLIRNVAIVGGTHGNELTGIHLLDRWAQLKSEISRPSFHTNIFLGNPKAAELNRRFVDEDLNRCFSLADLADPTKSTYESLRAVFLNQLIGPKGNPKHDLIIDIHTSTSNCGVMIILIDDSPYNLCLAAYILTNLPEAHIHYVPSVDGDFPYLNSITPFSLGVEIGPVPQGLLRSDIYNLANNVVRYALDYIHAANIGEKLFLPEAVEVFRFKETLTFPQQDCKITGLIYNSIQDRDYQPLEPGSPIFEMIDGTIIYYNGTETVYPVFINEAAYYQKGIAACLCTKERLPLPVNSE